MRLGYTWIEYLELEFEVDLGLIQDGLKPVINSINPPKLQP